MITHQIPVTYQSTNLINMMGWLLNIHNTPLFSTVRPHSLLSVIPHSNPSIAERKRSSNRNSTEASAIVPRYIFVCEHFGQLGFLEDHLPSRIQRRLCVI